jgi:uncharacterized protein (DUF1778 family)
VKRVNISLKQSQLNEITRLAKLAGLSRSAYLVQCALRRKEAKRGPKR